MTDARGSRIWDVDGNEYVDFDMAFGVLAAGHSHPILAEVLQHRVANGTCYTFPVEDSILLAEEIKRRFDADLVRFSNSGTEATMDAIRVARGFTGREKIIKFEGGYHGHHDDVLVSIQPPREMMGDEDVAERPSRVGRHPGQPAGGDGHRPVQPARSAGAASSRRHRGEIAAIIVEPVQFNIGVVPPLPGFLERLRELATAARRRAHLRRGQDRRRHRLRRRDRVLRRHSRTSSAWPRASAAACPIGAFGGRGEVMRRDRGADPDADEADRRRRATAASTTHHRRRREPRRTPGHVQRQPAVDGRRPRALTEILTRDAYPAPAGAWADRLTAGCQAVIDEFGLPGYAINVGPKGCVMFTPERVTNYRDFIGLDSELWTASFFYLVNRGILLPPGPDDQWTLSVQHTDEEIERHIADFRDFAAEVAG